MSKKIGMVSLGCPKNLVDTEVMLGTLKKDEFTITSNTEDADVIIINTCGFIESAKEESINTILEMCQYKNNSNKKIIVTGCLAQRYKDEILKNIPEVDGVVGVGNYGNMAKIITDSFQNEKVVHDGDFSSVEYLNLDREITTGKNYAYIKISEGCDNCCTYCIIPKLRGKYVSRSMEDIVDEAKNLGKKGIKEVILVAQDTTLYGKDIYGEIKLAELIKKVSEIEEISWIRVLYAYPEQINSQLIHEFANNKKVCKYLDIPIQHASDKVLKQMGRKGTNKEIKNVIESLRANVKGIIIRTTFIVGFPGEDEEDLNILKSFISEMKFDRVGVFKYSQEEGTPAANMKNQIPEEIKEYRYNEALELQQNIAIGKNQERLGAIVNVLVEGVSDDGIFYYGRSYGECPDVDGLIYFTTEEPIEINKFINVEILNIDKYDLIGRVIDESPE